jgi:hypothetical protein
MSPLVVYKEFVDALVARAPGVERAKVCKSRTFGPESKFADANRLVARLTDADREILAHMLEHARASAMHDALFVLHEFQERGRLQLVADGSAVPPEPFGTEPYFDFTARVAGEEWPDART